TALARGLHLLYADYPLGEDGGVADFHVRLTRPAGLRRWWRPQTIFYLGGSAPFVPFPLQFALPFLEWGVNWCVSSNAHPVLLLHAGVVERGGRALILPAASGTGKSTLCAGLIHRGWRLLSDEMVLLRPEDGRLVPCPRPVGLKGPSIDLLRAFAPQ